MSFFLIAHLAGLGALLLLSALCSGSEVALFSLSRIQVRRLRLRAPAAGQLISDLLDHPHRLLTTILLGNIVVNTAAAILGYHIVRSLWPDNPEVIAVPLMTGVLLLFGEVLPKAVMIQRAEVFALLLARPIGWAVAVAKWPREAAEALSSLVLRAAERARYFSATRARSTTLTEAEYRTLLGVSERAGVLQREERVMVTKILALEEMPVREIMTPRVDMQLVEDSLSVAEVAATIRGYKHRRVPVFHESRDNIVGMLNVKEFLVAPPATLAEALDPPQVVPETMSVARLLRLFRRQEHPVAIAVDEHGGTAGLVTIEDALEEIVGEIEDEFDLSEVMIQRLADGRFLINGKARLQVVNEQCGVALEATDVDTIAGWLVLQTDAMPREGQSVQVGNVRATARKVARNRVREVLLEVRGG